MALAEATFRRLRPFRWPASISRLPVRWKIRLVAVILALPLALVSAFFIEERSREIGFKETELAGLGLLERMDAATLGQEQDPATTAAKLRVLAVDPLAGDFERAARLLETGGASSLDYRLSMKRLIAEIGENYDLILDPDADTYFLNHAAVALMPVVPAAAAEIMDKLSRVAGAGPAPPSIVIDIASARRAMVQAVEDSRNEIERSQRARAELPPVLLPDLDRAVADHDRALDRILAQGASPELSDQLLGRYRALMSAQRALRSAVYHIASVRLQEHIARLESQLRTALIGTSLTLVLALLLSWRIAQSIVLPLRRMVDILSRVERSGHYDLRAEWQSQDEAGDAVRSLNRLLESLSTAEQALHHHETRMARVIAASNSGIFEVDEAAGHFYFSPRARELLALPDDFVWRPGVLATLLSPEDPDRVFSYILTLEPGRSMTFESYAARHDGTRFWAEVLLINIRGPTDQKLRFIAGLRDVTERKQALFAAQAAHEQEAALTAANTAKSAFLAHMTHELRQPINAILNYLELLREDADGPAPIDRASLSDDLIKVQLSAGHLRALIDQILDLSKIEAGQMTVESAPVPIGDLVRDIEVLVRPLAEKKNLAFEIRNRAEDCIVASDRLRLMQIVINLFSNAVKFTASGVVALEVDAGPEIVRFCVRDTGIGMNDEEMGRLFHDFMQARKDISARFGGTGLGLSLSRKFAHLMGGDIKVTSAVGKGSAFTLEIPRR